MHRGEDEEELAGIRTKRSRVGNASTLMSRGRPSKKAVGSVSVGGGRRREERRLRVLIVGAGVAGLSAGQTLKSAAGDKLDLVVLEGRDRLGGRVYTVSLGETVLLGAVVRERISIDCFFLSFFFRSRKWKLCRLGCELHPWL